MKTLPFPLHFHLDILELYQLLNIEMLDYYILSTHNPISS